MKRDVRRYQGFILEEINDTFCLTFDNYLTSETKKCLRSHGFKQKRGLRV